MAQRGWHIKMCEQILIKAGLKHFLQKYFNSYIGAFKNVLELLEMA